MVGGGKADRKFVAGIGISLFFLFLLFRKIEFYKLAAAFREMEYGYLWPAVFLTFVSYFFRAVRWRFLLLPLKTAPMGSLFSSTIIGYMANNLLPARLGEFVRAYVLAEKERLPVSAVFATLVLDRLFDGFTVLLILLLTVFTLQLPPGMEKVQQAMVMGGYVTLGIYLFIIVFIYVLKTRTVWTLHLLGMLLKPFPATVSEKVIPMLGTFIGGLRLSNKPRDVSALILSSLLVWVTATWPIDLLLRAFGLTLPISASMFILVFLVFAVMVPASPGYVGTYHFACVTALTAFNIQSEKALSIALVIHGVSFFPVIILGLFYLSKENLSFRKLARSSVPQEHLVEKQ